MKDAVDQKYNVFYFHLIIDLTDELFIKNGAVNYAKNINGKIYYAVNISRVFNY